MNEEFSVLLIDLDSLFDIRASFLYGFVSPEALENELVKGYYKRTADEFDGFTIHDFNKIMKHRNKKLLKDAVITNIKDTVRSFVISTVTNYVNSPVKLLPKIVVNIHPYKLVESEIEQVKLGVIAITDGKVDIEIVNLSDTELTPRYIKNNVSLLIKYYFHDWLEYHSEHKNFVNFICPEVGMLTPALYSNRRPTMEEEIYLRNNNTNYFQDLEKFIEPVIGIKFLPAGVFSMKYQ